MKMGRPLRGSRGKDAGRAEALREEVRGMNTRPDCGARTGAGRVEAGAATGARGIGIGRGAVTGAGWKPPRCCGVKRAAEANARESEPSDRRRPAAWLEEPSGLKT